MIFIIGIEHMHKCNSIFDLYEVASEYWAHTLIVRVQLITMYVVDTVSQVWD